MQPREVQGPCSSACPRSSAGPVLVNCIPEVTSISSCNRTTPNHLQVPYRLYHRMQPQATAACNRRQQAHRTAPMHVASPKLAAHQNCQAALPSQQQPSKLPRISQQTLRRKNLPAATLEVAKNLVTRSKNPHEDMYGD
ncbi:hypothetical protein SEVIR_2G176751v4 [Setaria viridis]